MTADVSIKDVTVQREGGILHHMIGSQAFWVTIAVVVICICLLYTSPSPRDS